MLASHKSVCSIAHIMQSLPAAAAIPLASVFQRTDTAYHTNDDARPTPSLNIVIEIKRGVTPEVTMNRTGKQNINGTSNMATQNQEADIDKITRTFNPPESRPSSPSEILDTNKIKMTQGNAIKPATAAENSFNPGSMHLNPAKGINKYDEITRKINIERSRISLRPLLSVEELKSRWIQKISAAKAVWSQLSENELLESGGHKRPLVGLILAKHTISRDEANKQVNQFFEQHMS